MRRIFRISLVLLIVLGGMAPLYAQTQPQIMQDERGIPTIAPLLEKVTPAVVNITMVAEVQAPVQPFADPFSPFFAPQQRQPRREIGAGSGVIVDAENGYILTNNHVVKDVVKNGGEITVTLKDKRTYKATVIGTDAPTDLALIQIKADHLTALPLGDSERLKVGDFVVAIGNPFGLGQTVTSGIVSALGRSGINPQGYEDFIQTDASINPGNSGGALVTYDGKLVGINSAIIAPSGGNVGIGFAIPVNMAKSVMSQLIEYGKVRRGLLGVAIQDLTPDIADALGLDVTQGALIAKVQNGSPAETAGLKPGDVVVALNGNVISDAEELRGYLGVMPPDKEFTLTVVRPDGKHQIKARLSQTKQENRQTARSEVLSGAVFRPVEQALPGYGQVQGLGVVDVARGSPAALFGLRPGDVIIEANRKPVHSVDDLDAALQSGGNAVALLIWRDGAMIYLLLRR